MWNPCRDEWLPSYRVIHLDCVVIEQKPALSIVPISEGFLGAFHTPKGGDREPSREKKMSKRNARGVRTKVMIGRLWRT